MKNLSKKILVLALLLGSLGIYSCKKEVGPKGDSGTDGNANVTQINFGSKTILDNVVLTLTLPGITKSIADKSLILIYGQYGFNGEPWFPMSGMWKHPYSNNEYYTLIRSSDPASSIAINIVTGSGSQTLKDIRVLVIPANVFVNGRSATPSFDINDYESVRQYFNLPK